MLVGWEIVVVVRRLWLWFVGWSVGVSFPFLGGFRRRFDKVFGVALFFEVFWSRVWCL